MVFQNYFSQKKCFAVGTGKYQHPAKESFDGHFRLDGHQSDISFPLHESCCACVFVCVRLHLSEMDCSL